MKEIKTSPNNQFLGGFFFETYFSIFGFILISPRTMMSEKSIRNLLSKVAILHQKNKPLYTEHIFYNLQGK